MKCEYTRAEALVARKELRRALKRFRIYLADAGSPFEEYGVSRIVNHCEDRIEELTRINQRKKTTA